MFKATHKISSFLLILFLFVTSFTLNSCKDAPCQLQARHKEQIEYASQAVKELGFLDYFGQGFGVSTKVKDRFMALRSAVVDYHNHLCSCSNSNCKAQAKTELQKCKEIIAQLDEAMESHDLAKSIGQIFGMLLFLL